MVLKFKVLELHQLHNLSNDQTGYQIRDRYSFCRFLGLNPKAGYTMTRRCGCFAGSWCQQGLVEPLFAQFSQQAEQAGYPTRKGRIVDASIVSAPKQRNARDGNPRIMTGGPP